MDDQQSINQIMKDLDEVGKTLNSLYRGKIQLDKQTKSDLGEVTKELETLSDDLYNKKIHDEGNGASKEGTIQYFVPIANLAYAVNELIQNSPYPFSKNDMKTLKDYADKADDWWDTLKDTVWNWLE